MVFAQLIVYGIVLGSILALAAVGVSLIFSQLRFAHFAHGDMVTFGAYFGLLFTGTLALPLYLAFPLALAATGILAVAIDQLLYRRLRRSQPVILLISSIGVALMLRSVIQMVWGPDNRNYGGGGVSFPYEVLGLRIKPEQIVIIVGTVLLVTALHLFLTRTKTGKAMRATADNASLARVTGIDTERVILWAWIITAVLAAAAGLFLGLDTRLNPIMGWRILLPIFAAALVGGIGNYYGAIAGGLIIGLSQELSTAVISPAYKPAVAFAIMVLVLILRPRGIFARRREVA